MPGQLGIFIIIQLGIFLMFLWIPALARTRNREVRRVRLLGSAEVLFNDGRTAYREKKYQEAIRFLKQAALLKPERAMIHYYLGLSYTALGDFEEAEKAYRDALRRDPKNNTVWSELGDLYRKLNRREDAVKAYQQALQIKPDLATALRMRRYETNTN